MTHDTQKQWLLSRICKKAVQRKRPSTSERSEKSCSLTYIFLDNSGKEIQVCQTFFVRTLGYNSNRVIVELVKKAKSSTGGMSTVQPDKRG